RTLHSLITSPWLRRGLKQNARRFAQYAARRDEIGERRSLEFAQLPLAAVISMVRVLRPRVIPPSPLTPAPQASAARCDRRSGAVPPRREPPRESSPARPASGAAGWPPFARRRGRSPRTRRPATTGSR